MCFYQSLLYWKAKFWKSLLFSAIKKKTKINTFILQTDRKSILPENKV